VFDRQLGASYPEPFDKPHNGKEKPGFILTPCVNSFLKGSCGNGHRFLKALSCGKEWCKDCGEFESMIHQRRIARWFGRVLQMPKLGYLVVTVPSELRGEFLNRKMLSEFRTYCKRKLQRMGYMRGLVRYHWAGDCNHCNGTGLINSEECIVCKGTGAGREFKPHLNFLIDEGYLTPEQFEKKFVTFRKDVGKWFTKKFSHIAPGKFSGNLFYSYASDASHKVHKLKYITRATWRLYKKEVVDVIKGYRTSSVWGKFEKPEVNRVSELVSLESNQCPCCGFDVKWKKDFIFRKTFHKMKTEHIAAGYFYINDP
jgi:hypothetical protein